MTTENQPEPEPKPETDLLVPELVGSSEELTAEAVAKPVRRGRVAAIAGAALLAVAVIGGVGFTVVTVNGADRDAGDAV